MSLLMSRELHFGENLVRDHLAEVEMVQLFLAGLATTLQQLRGV